MWPFSSQRAPLPEALDACWQALRQRGWRSLDVPQALADGVPEPEGGVDMGAARVLCMPSPYDAPEGIRGTRRGEAWAFEFRYLDGDEDGRWRQVATATASGWVRLGRNSLRLRGLAGWVTAWPEEVLVAWLNEAVSVTTSPCSHQAILRAAWQEHEQDGGAGLFALTGT